MFDIYSLAKPRVFKTEHEGSGTPDPSDTPTPSETPAPDSVEYESMILNESIGTISEEEAEKPEAVGRVTVEIMNSDNPKSINIINAASDFGGRAKRIMNNPSSSPDVKIYRTEFRPKQGIHNLDFTTPAETPSDDTPSDDAQ